MPQNKLYLLLLPALVVLLWYQPVSASWGVECQETQTQTQSAAARLKRGQFVRIRMISGREVSGYFRSFDGSLIILEDKYKYATESFDFRYVVRIRTGRGFFGSLRHGFSRAGWILARPVTYWIEGYQIIDALQM